MERDRTIIQLVLWWPQQDVEYSVSDKHTVQYKLVYREFPSSIILESAENCSLHTVQYSDICMISTCTIMNNYILGNAHDILVLCVQVPRVSVDGLKVFDIDVKRCEGELLTDHPHTCTFRWHHLMCSCTHTHTIWHCHPSDRVCEEHCLRTGARTEATAISSTRSYSSGWPGRLHLCQAQTGQTMMAASLCVVHCILAVTAMTCMCMIQSSTFKYNVHCIDRGIFVCWIFVEYYFHCHWQKFTHVLFGVEEIMLVSSIFIVVGHRQNNIYKVKNFPVYDNYENNTHTHTLCVHTPVHTAVIHGDYSCVHVY